MRQKERETAKHFGILERVGELERRLAEIDHVVDVEFDLDGFWSNIRQVIIVPKYDIPAGALNYYDVRREMLNRIVDTASSFGLLPSGDRIEDYGEHLYIVRDCDNTWKRNFPGEEQKHMDADASSKACLSEQISAAASRAALQDTAIDAPICRVTFCRSGGIADHHQFDVDLYMTPKDFKTGKEEFLLEGDERIKAYDRAAEIVGEEAVPDYTILSARMLIADQVAIGTKYKETGR